MNKTLLVSSVIVVVFLAVVIGFVYLYVPKPDSTPKSTPGGMADLGPSSDDDPAFFNANYKDSTNSLNRKEKTVTYTYPDSPCGTLTTQFSKVGSVRVGRGPVYSLASEQCSLIDPSYVPNDFSFRVYACENVNNVSGIQGKATFAFQCSPVDEDSRCSEARVNGEIGEPDWNCAGI